MLEASRVISTVLPISQSEETYFNQAARGHSSANYWVLACKFFIFVASAASWKPAPCQSEWQNPL